VSPETICVVTDLGLLVAQSEARNRPRELVFGVNVTWIERGAIRSIRADASAYAALGITTLRIDLLRAGIRDSIAVPIGLPAEPLRELALGLAVEHPERI